MQHEEAVIYQEQDGVAMIRLNRPGKLNALNRTMCRQLNGAFEQFLANDDMRVGVYVAAGRSFSAGVDLADLQAALTEAETEMVGLISPQFEVEFEERQFCEKPVIAAIQGQCYGFGFTSALACDLRIATDDAVFCLPEVKLGAASVHGNLRVVQQAGLARAMELLLTGEKRDATWAKEAGIVNEVVPRAELEAQAMDYASAIANMDPYTVYATRKVAVMSQFAGFDDIVAIGAGLRLRAKADSEYSQKMTGTRQLV